MRVDAFDFDLPEHLIALRPARPRTASRLLHVTAGGAAFADRAFADLPDILRAGDVLVFNDTRVIPARLIGRRTGRGETAPRIEATLHMRTGEATWAAFAKPARKLEAGDRVRFGSSSETCLQAGFDATVRENRDGGEVVLDFDLAGPMLDEALQTHGVMPLPPYIASRRAPDAEDRHDYQTVYARRDGAVAAPTAGLHFSNELLARLSDMDVLRAEITLHVGAGTFLPVKAHRLEDHKMHAELAEIAHETAAVLNDARDAGGRIVAVGTTALRTLETCLDADGRYAAYRGATDIFIHPGRPVRSADLLITNFHLPRSTLFMLVCAFSGTERMKRAYAHAIAEAYRFYSYGDACLLERSS